ncbi:MAG: hypothetical protein GY699_00970 [Desulfobacteraceae bacterium]|nr:hypothetical protein [Desulfobacteraceae bacterium]
MKAGFDFGSKNIGYAIIDDHEIVFKNSTSHNGNISKTFKEIIIGLAKVCKVEKIESFGVTGNINLQSIKVFDPVVASVEANNYLKTGCRNIVSIGCESFYLIRLDEQFRYVEHIVNSDCASGTGGFIDQQAERLGISTPQLAKWASKYKDAPPSIATRCAVFAKSDIIHAQTQGFSKQAICSGLCKGVARSVLANTVKGRQLPGNILFTGGVSLNQKIIDEISKQLSKKVIVSKENIVFNALGAAVLGRHPFDDIQGVFKDMSIIRDTRAPLKISLKNYPDFSEDHSYEDDGVEITLYEILDKNEYSVYIGIDVGSTSTKAIVMSSTGQILTGLYSGTKGDPVKAVSILLLKLKQIFTKKELTILGVGTTGSGRELVYQVIKADQAINEITAHAIGATFIDPDVDTIIEIGGQDSKFTQLKNGMVTNAVMNYVCAAGTGSFIEEQATRLSITLDEISDMAMGQKAPYTSDRCTVYMERDLNIFLSEGWDPEQIIAAVLYSVRDNYLSKVVGKSLIGDHVYFQGATARNKALVAVFENELGKTISVSKYCHLTGALGCAVSLMEQNLKQSRFSGVDFQYEITLETCELCTNQCELRVYTVGHKKTAWGLKCGRDYKDNKTKAIKKVSKFEAHFNKAFKVEDQTPYTKFKVGIPQTLYMKEYGSLFKDFFQQLGFKVVLEKSSDRKLSTGMKMINADFCAPMALSHGMVESLSKKDVDFIFLPAIINEQSLVEKLSDEMPFTEKMTDAYFCYYSSYAPAIIDNLPSYNFKVPIVSPKIKFNNINDETIANNLAKSLTKDILVSEEKIRSAFLQANANFNQKKKYLIEYGNKILSKADGKQKILLLGRPYALFDKSVNLGIPIKLEKMGFDLVSQAMLDLDIKTIKPDHIENMHWYFGQQILMAAQIAARTKDVYPVFLTCFRCSPDAYLITYFKEIMENAGKPYLVLQLDEHSSDVGYMTRIEAAVDTFKNDFRSKVDKKNIVQPVKTNYSPDRFKKGDTILIPATDTRINTLQKCVFESAGFKAKVLDLDTAMMNLGYRYASGGECLPNIAITGSIVDALQKRELDPDKAIVYLPNICLSCNFNQYANLIKVACRNAGFNNLRVMNFNGLQSVPDVSSKTNAHLLSVTILSSILEKLRYRFQPYEEGKGETLKQVKKSEDLIKNCIIEKKSLINAAKQIKAIFEQIDLPMERKPKIGILGDMYAKFNTVLNDHICDYVESLGGQILLPSYNELAHHALHADMVENNQDERLLLTMTRYEQRFENIFKGLIDDNFEPSQFECANLVKEFGIQNFIVGETAISVGRMLYYIKHDLVDAVIHVNPLLCCPGVISSSIFRNIQDTYNIPIIDLFYDGTNKPNKIIEPHMFYLKRKEKGRVI